MKIDVKTLGRQRGFTLLEVMLVVVIMGVVLTAVMVAHNQSASKATASEAVFMDSAVAALFKYVKRNNRLPCPDINGDGLEDAVGGVCTTLFSSGGIPYVTIEMPLSSPVGTSLDRQYVYGVFRGGGDVSKDLTRNEERSQPTLHIPPNVSYKNLDDFKQAVINASQSTSTVVTSSIYVTGNDANSGASNCSSNLIANVAFLIAFAGARNADGQGSDFDGVNLPGAGWSDSTKWDSAKATTCFAGPDKPITAEYDDQVRAVDFSELIGVLSR